jgi:hypothetical protein
MLKQVQHDEKWSSSLKYCCLGIEYELSTNTNVAPGGAEEKWSGSYNCSTISSSFTEIL